MEPGQGRQALGGARRPLATIDVAESLIVRARFAPAVAIEHATQRISTHARAALYSAAAVLADQWPFHFAEPRGAALTEYLRRTAGLARYAPDVIRHFAAQEYGGIDVEHRLGEVT